MSDFSSAPPPSSKTSTAVGPSPVASGDSTPQRQPPDKTTAEQAKSTDATTQAPDPAVTLAASLGSVTPGQRVEAIVVTEGNGKPTVLASASGTFLVNNGPALKANSHISLQIQDTGQPIRATLVAVDGEAQRPAPEVQLSLTDVGGAHRQGAAESAHGTAAVEPGAEVRGQIIRAPERPAAADEAQPEGRNPRPGSEVVFRVVQVEAPRPRGEPAAPERDTPAQRSSELALGAARAVPAPGSQPPPAPAEATTAAPAASGQTGPSTAPAAAAETQAARQSSDATARATLPAPNTAPGQVARIPTTSVDERVAPPSPPGPADERVQSAAPPPETATRGETSSGPPPDARSGGAEARAGAPTAPDQTRMVAIVIGKTAAGQTILETPLGLVALDRASVAVGTAVTLDVVHRGEASAQAPPLTAVLPIGTQITATLVEAAPAAPQVAGAAPPLPAIALDDTVALTVRAVAPPAVEAAPAPAGSTHGTAVPPSATIPVARSPIPGASTAAAGAVQTGQATGQPPAPHGTSSSGTAVAPDTPAGPVPAAPPPQAHTATETAAAITGASGEPLRQITATVVGQDGTGRLLVRTEIGVLAIENLEAVPLGTRLELDAVVQAAKPADSTAAPASVTSLQSALASFASAWPALEEIVTVVDAQDKGVAQRFLDSRIPGPNTRLASSMLFFFVAIGAGVPRAWLGDQMTRTLERAGRHDLIDRLAEDFGQMKRLVDERGPGDWRTLLFPFLDGRELHQVRMYARYAEGQGEEGEKDRDLRFVVDLTLSRMGELQLDGLVQPQRFDLIVRSKVPLSEANRQEIADIFAGSQEATGMNGSIVFQTGEFPVSPLDDLMRPEVNHDAVDA